MKLAKLLTGLTFAATALFAMPAISQASALIDQGNVTLDIDTHLQWLDLTKTQGLAAEDVLDNVGVNYVADGWRYATAPEIARLWSDAGFAPGNYGDTGQPPVPAGIGNLQNLMGVTEQHLGGVFYSGGLYQQDSADPNTNYGVATLQRYLSPDGGPLALASIDPLNLLPFETASSLWGSYLVHAVPVAATPLPAGLPMFATAIALLGLAGWRRRLPHHIAGDRM